MSAICRFHERTMTLWPRQTNRARNARTKASALSDFDIDQPKLPAWIADAELTSGGYPYDKKLKRKAYERDLQALQIELLKLQAHTQKTGMRIVLVFEGRDSAGKGDALAASCSTSIRATRAVALTKPTEASNTNCNEADDKAPRIAWCSSIFALAAASTHEMVNHHDRTDYSVYRQQPVGGTRATQETTG